MEKRRFDVVVIGGGLVGLATARAAAVGFRPSVLLLEAEAALAEHQSGRNSGVVHSGLYYRPGSIKARYCGEARLELFRFCERHEIPAERCGKLVVATSNSELPALESLAERGANNGLSGLRRLGPQHLHHYEPHVQGVGGLWVPETGIVDFVRVARALADEAREAGAEIRTGARVERVQRTPSGFVLHTPEGEFEARLLVNCAGLQADRVARLCGLRPTVRIVPFRGEYSRLRPGKRHLVRHLIYPVPDPRLPFLGVHLTRRIRGEIEVGPNAVLAFCREGYRAGSFSMRDTVATLSYPGFWRLASRFWRTGIGELYRSWSRRAMWRAVQNLLPDLEPEDLVPAGCGVRAQAVSPRGRLVDDFHLAESERTLHVLNAPSPAATACLSIGRELARRLSQRV